VTKCVANKTTDEFVLLTNRFVFETNVGIGENQKTLRGSAPNRSHPAIAAQFLRLQNPTKQNPPKCSDLLYFHSVAVMYPNECFGNNSGNLGASLILARDVNVHVRVHRAAVRIHFHLANNCKRSVLPDFAGLKMEF